MNYCLYNYIDNTNLYEQHGDCDGVSDRLVLGDCDGASGGPGYTASMLQLLGGER